MQDMTIGSIVHYKIADGEIRPAVVVNSLTEDSVNLHVLLDFTNDKNHINDKSQLTVEECERGTAWRTSVHKGTEAGEWNTPGMIS